MVQAAKTVHGAVFLQESVDVETAKVAGRQSFSAMLAYLRKQPPCHTLVVEKTDRLHRNLKDWVTIDDFGLEIHFPKETLSSGPNPVHPKSSCMGSRSSWRKAM